jgi:hypothetical protein
MSRFNHSNAKRKTSSEIESSIVMFRHENEEKSRTTEIIHTGEFNGEYQSTRKSHQVRPHSVCSFSNSFSTRFYFSSTDSLITMSSNTYFNLLPSSSLPPRKRQQMKYFLESRFSCDFLLVSTLPRILSPSLSSLSAEAYLLLIQFITSTSSGQTRTDHFEQLLDQSSACGKAHRLMLTALCHQWTGDIRTIHANLRPELNSFLPHVLVLNILSSKPS